LALGACSLPFTHCQAFKSLYSQPISLKLTAWDEALLKLCEPHVWQPDSDSIGFLCKNGKIIIANIKDEKVQNVSVTGLQGPVTAVRKGKDGSVTVTQGRQTQVFLINSKMLG
jgi:hypothetical protein